MLPLIPIISLQRMVPDILVWDLRRVDLEFLLHRQRAELLALLEDCVREAGIDALHTFRPKPSFLSGLFCVSDGRQSYMAFGIEEADATTRFPHLLRDRFLCFNAVTPDAADVDDGNLVAVDSRFRNRCYCLPAGSLNVRGVSVAVVVVDVEDILGHAPGEMLFASAAGSDQEVDRSGRRVETSAANSTCDVLYHASCPANPSVGRGVTSS